MNGASQSCRTNYFRKREQHEQRFFTFDRRQPRLTRHHRNIRELQPVDALGRLQAEGRFWCLRSQAGQQLWFFEPAAEAKTDEVKTYLYLIYDARYPDWRGAPPVPNALLSKPPPPQWFERKITERRDA